MSTYDVEDPDGNEVWESFEDLDDAKEWAKLHRGRVVHKGQVLLDVPKETAEIEEAMSELGFENIGTGGGCDAYYKRLPGGDPKEPPHILVTDDCNVPETWDASVTVGRFKGERNEGEYEYFDSAREMVEAIRQGRSRLVPVPSGKLVGPGARSAVRQALNTINRHRRRIGQAQLDPEAVGWSDGDVLDEAKRLKELGLVNNPTAEIKARMLEY